MKTTPDNTTSTLDPTALCAAELAAVVAELQQRLAAKEAEIERCDQLVRQRDNYI